MEKLTLSVFVGKHGQANTANLLGVRQSAINKALKYKRNIVITLHENGDVEAEEWRKFPSQQPRKVPNHA